MNYRNLEPQNRHMKSKLIPLNTLVDGKELYAVELTNELHSSVKILNYGTIIQRFLVRNRNGESQSIVLGFDEFTHYIDPVYLQHYPYLGSVIGRYANRIKDGKFEIEGKVYQLAQNNETDCLHGGITGFDKRVWEVNMHSPDLAKVTFSYLSPDGEEGFPGNLQIHLTFELTNENELILTYQAETDQATVLNLTHHSYFNLAPDGGLVHQHRHQMPASHYLEQDCNFVTTGRMLPVEGSIHDFRTPRPIAANWDSENGYDQSYVLDKPYQQLGLASRTYEAKSGLTLEVYSTEPVAHFYTAKHLQVPMAEKGYVFQPFEAFCVETQHHPNAVNIPEFPSTELRKGEVYRQTTIYKVFI